MSLGALIGRKRASPRVASAGFTLIEVLVALLLAMLGLLGTVAIQQTVLSATQNANDASIALRLATQAMEEFSVRTTASPAQDLLAGPAAATGNQGIWSPIQYLDSNGRVSATQTPTNRWNRQWRVTNVGAGLPYDISVVVTYNLDGGNPKTVRLDVERRKSW